jgi:hypothetical protein
MDNCVVFQGYIGVQGAYSLGASGVEVDDGDGEGARGGQVEGQGTEGKSAALLVLADSAEEPLLL